PAAALMTRMTEYKQLMSQTFAAVGDGTRRETQQGGPQGILNNAKRRYVEQTFETLQGTQWLKLDMNPATGSGGTCYGDSGGPHFLGGWIPTSRWRSRSPETRSASRRTSTSGSTRRRRGAS